MSNLTINQYRDYASLFSRSVALDWFKGDFSAIDYKIERYDKNRFAKTSKTYLDYLKYAYESIEKHYPNEYVYKNTFLNEWLINELGDVNAKVFSEFRLGKTVADLVMFNGVSKVFEIKTELDTTMRLDNQIDSYKDVFNEIYLIVPLSKLEQFLSFDDSVGVISFSNERDQKFKTERQAIRNVKIKADSLMHVLHTNEYKNIVSKYFEQLPPFNSFNQFQVCAKLLAQIPNEELNQLFIKQLKKRGEKNELSVRNYSAFNQLSLALKLSREERALLFQNLKTPIQI